MVRTQVQLDEATYEAVRRIAHRRHVSMSAVVREILNEHLTDKPGPPRQFAFIAAGASGYHDTAARHDEVLGEFDR